jgi:hypothetical protein
VCCQDCRRAEGSVATRLAVEASWYRFGGVLSNRVGQCKQFGTELTDCKNELAVFHAAASRDRSSM